MATRTTRRPTALTPAPLPRRETTRIPFDTSDGNADLPAPTVLSALHWNEIFGPWVRGRHNCRPVVEAALAQARTRRS